MMQRRPHPRYYSNSRTTPDSSSPSAPGCSTVQLPHSIGKQFKDKTASKIKNASGYQNSSYECNSNEHFKRWSYKNSKCANTEAQVEDCGSTNTSKTLMDSLKLFYVFTRPYACFGVIFIIASSSLIAIESVSDISLHFLVALLKVVAAFSCLIIYINGINELYDIEIDKINKPYLPLASGEMTIETGVLTVSYFALLAFAIGISIGSTSLLWGIFLFFIILSAYSVKLPFLRWKSSAIGAASSMFTSFAVVLPVSSYLHMQTCVFGRQANFPRPLAFGTSAMSLFFIVIALFKDIPDIEGDRKFGIHSLATRLGQKKVFWICVYLLELVYTFAIVVGAASSHPWSKHITVVSHAILSLILWKQAKSTNYMNKSEISSFYQFIWKLLYAECLLIPLVR
ncbi:hypothetical protein KSP39_PZI021350 [Platanthera zijinensis]|uniref:Uncharacterized protein n=1 Tax=Platanthera zijinensis TaxID=2320716 RepID=A0AAP0FWC1_9ASPA